MFQLEVPLIRQAEESSDCGPACIAMLLKYYGVDFDFDKMKQEVGVYPWGTVTPQLGTFFLKHDFAVEIITMHPALFSIHSKFKDAEALKIHLTSLESRMKGEFDPIALKHFLDFIDNGGLIIPRVPTLKDVQNALSKKQPVLVPVTHWFLHEKKMPPRFSIHFNIVTGLDDQFVFVNDPDWGDDLGGKHKIERDNFIYAMYASAKGGIDDACLMRVTKR